LFPDNPLSWISTDLTSVSSAFSFLVCPLIPPSSFATVFPANNAQSVNYTSIAFSWGTSTNQVQISLSSFFTLNSLLELSFLFDSLSVPTPRSLTLSPLAQVLPASLRTTLAPVPSTPCPSPRAPTTGLSRLWTHGGRVPRPRPPLS